MIGAKVKFSKWSGEKGFDRWNQKFIDNLAEMMMEGARVWIATVVDNASKTFPVQTGCAKASLIPIGRYLGYPVTINPTRAPYGKVFHRSIPSGIDAGKNPPYFVIHTGSAPTLGPHKLEFEWTSDVPYFEDNELHHQPHFSSRVLQTPWEIVKDAYNAYDEFIRDNWKRYVPELKKHLIEAGYV